MKLLFGHDREVAHWVAERIPHSAKRIPDFGFGEVFGPGAAIGVIDRQGQLVAGVVYHNYDPYCRSIELSCASEGSKWLTRDILRALLRYVFSQVQCQRCTAVTPRRATSARRFLERIGFKREGVARLGFGDDHAMIYGMLSKEWAAHPLNRETPRGAAVEQKIGPSATTSP